MREVTIAYGMTETSPVSTQTRTDDDLDGRDDEALQELTRDARPRDPDRRNVRRRRGRYPDVDDRRCLGRDHVGA